MWGGRWSITLIWTKAISVIFPWPSQRNSILMTYYVSSQMSDYTSFDLEVKLKYCNRIAKSNLFLNHNVSHSTIPSSDYATNLFLGGKFFINNDVTKIFIQEKVLISSQILKCFKLSLKELRHNLEQRHLKNNFFW